MHCSRYLPYLNDCNQVFLNPVFVPPCFKIQVSFPQDGFPLVQYFWSSEFKLMQLALTWLKLKPMVSMNPGDMIHFDDLRTFFQWGWRQPPTSEAPQRGLPSRTKRRKQLTRTPPPWENLQAETMGGQTVQHRGVAKQRGWERSWASKIHSLSWLYINFWISGSQESSKKHEDVAEAFWWIDSWWWIWDMAFLTVTT